MKIKKNLNKKGQGNGVWDKTALYILMALTIVVIIAIFIFIRNRIKNIFF